jgi:hypothetical protein
MNFKLVPTCRVYKPIHLNFKSPLPSFPPFPAHLLVLEMDSMSGQNFYNEHNSLHLPDSFNESQSNTPAYSGVGDMPGSQRGPWSVGTFSNARRSWSGPMASSDNASWGSSPMGSSPLPHPSVKLQALSLSLLAAFGLFHFHNTFTFTLRPLCNSFQAFISLEIKVLDVMVKCPPRLYQRPNNNPHRNTPQVSPMHLVRIQKAPRATNREWVGYAL